MSEGPPSKREGMTLAEYISLAEELSQNPEGFPFPGLNPDAYAKIKADEARSDPYHPDRTPSIEARMQHFRNQGMKVVLGKNPQSGDVYILPRGSDDIEQDALFPKHLDIHDGMDPKLVELIEASKKPRPRT